MIVTLPDDRIINLGHVTFAAFCPEPLRLELHLSGGSVMEVSGYPAKGLWSVISEMASMIKITAKGELQVKQQQQPGNGIVIPRNGFG